jgi:ribosome-binding protein aMBF1 (putative translation factor)
MARRTLDEVYAARGDRDTPEFRDAYDEAARAAEFGIMVAGLRRAAGLTQQQLATRMRTTQSVVSRIEQGGRAPTFATLDRIARALGVDLVLGPEERDAPRIRFGSAA